MKHYLSFIQWLLIRVTRGVMAGPRRFFAWYKGRLYYETFLTILASIVGWAMMLFAGAIASATNINGKLVVEADDVWPFMIALFVPPVVFIVACISIQYDHYCSELERTMKTLKGKHDSV